MAHHSGGDGGGSHCVFDIGAQGEPAYLRIAEQRGVNCKFILKQTRNNPAGSTTKAKTYVYTLQVEYDASASCGSAALHPTPPLCPDPPQPPKVEMMQLLQKEQGFPKECQ